MLKHHCSSNCAPKVSEEDKEKFVALITDKPWLIPATVMLEIIPVSIVAYGFWKNCNLKRKLQIEHQKTVRAYIEKTSSDTITPDEFCYLKHI